MIVHQIYNEETKKEMSADIQLLYDQVNDLRLSFKDITNEELVIFLNNIQEPLDEIQVTRDFGNIVDSLCIPEPKKSDTSHIKWNLENIKNRRNAKQELFSLKEDLQKRLQPVRHG